MTHLLAPAYRWATVGMVSLVFLAAFESLAVTTVMATISRDLDGREWYSVAFSATLAASVIGMVAGGRWADRRGAVPPLLASVGVFVLGLLAAGTAPGIEVFVAARFLQGLGSGAMTVALYVLVAQVYDEVDRPRVFGAFAAAWVIPSLVGPPLAGLVADTVGWRWVFLGVIVLAAAATAALVPAIREAEPPTHDAGTTKAPLLVAVTVAAAVVVVDLSGRVDGVLRVALAVGGLLAVATTVRRLLPRGTLVAHRGLPSVIALRGLVSAAFFASEIYVPYLLQSRYDAAPWQAGLALTVGGLGWAAASQVQGHWGAGRSDPELMVAGATLLTAGIAAQLLIALLHLSPAFVPLAWVAAGAGMGMAYPRIGSYVLRTSEPHERGTNSAAMSIADAVGASTSIALAGLLFTGVGTETWGGFQAVFTLALVAAATAAVVSRRTTGQRPFHTGGRFSANAVAPSMLSSETNTGWTSSD